VEKKKRGRKPGSSKKKVTESVETDKTAEDVMQKIITAESVPAVKKENSAAVPRNPVKAIIEEGKLSAAESNDD